MSFSFSFLFFFFFFDSSFTVEEFMLGSFDIRQT